ncbi:hypothetical protein MTO96_025355 [Rhipicephalus appendiculatus]
MPVAYVLILDLALVTLMVGHTSARRPQIPAEELFQKSTSGSDAACRTRRRGAAESLGRVPASSPRRGTNDLLRQLLGEESRLARALNSYLHAKYPNQWKEVSLGRRFEGQDRAVDKESANAAEIDSVDTVDPDLLAILDRGGIRIADAVSTESVMSSSTAKQSDSKDDGRSAKNGSQAEKDKRNDMVVDVKEGDMAIGPKRRPMTRSPNSLR